MSKLTTLSTGFMLNIHLKEMIIKTSFNFAHYNWQKQNKIQLKKSASVDSEGNGLVPIKRYLNM